jgi:CRP-like cAMP-binding protein
MEMKTSRNDIPHNALPSRVLWDRYRDSAVERRIPARSVLLREGERARNIFFITRGCLRAWFGHRGKEITLQFFFEGEAVSSIESFREGTPSTLSIESIEPSTVLALPRAAFLAILQESPDVREYMHELMFQRFAHYLRLFQSRIRDTPAERYADLLRTHPHIVQRVPLRYIASYLGITPVSLSRIRARAGFVNKR